MRNSLPKGFIPNPKAARVHGLGTGWHITLSDDATVYEIAALSNAFGVQVVGYDSEALILAPRSDRQYMPTQAEVERAILNHARVSGLSSDSLAATG